MLVLTPAILASIQNFKTKIIAYQTGQLDNLKPYSSIMGVYKEGPQDTYMVRPRIAGGVTTIEQLQGLASIATKYNLRLRFTTRQDLQLHSVQLQYLAQVLDDLVNINLITNGAGGDGIRNIACSPLSGVAVDEVFDVTAYVEAITNFMLQAPENSKLPRKFKVSFSNNDTDTANATISDIGFIATLNDNKPGFAVYGAGGLGGGAQLSLKLADFINAEDALFYVEAMKRVFAREGNRSNRNQARLRFVRQRLGDIAFLECFRMELSSLRKSNPSLKLDITPPLKKLQALPASHKDAKYQNIVIPQMQPGLYSFYIHPRNAEISSDNLSLITSFLSQLPYKTSIRLTLSQGFFVRNLKSDIIKPLLDLVQPFSSCFPIENGVACVGPTICNFGINNSQDLLEGIWNVFHTQPADIKGALPRPHISGCHNSCAQHQKGSIGFTGRKKRVGTEIIETYLLFLGGQVGTNAKFGEQFGELAAKTIPEFLLQLAILKTQFPSLSFVDFLSAAQAQIRQLVKYYQQ